MRGKGIEPAEKLENSKYQRGHRRVLTLGLCVTLLMLIKLRLTQRPQVAKGNSYQRKGNCLNHCGRCLEDPYHCGSRIARVGYESVSFYQLTKRGLKVA